MTSLTYEVICSRLFSKIEAYDFIELSAEDLDDFLCNWIHSSTANPYVRKLFTVLNLDDEKQTLSYEMKLSVDEASDEDFVVEVVSLGMVVAWLEPKVNSINNIAQMFGSKEEKFYSQSQHLSELRSLVNDSKKTQRRMIADRGYVWNSYLGGE
jgi:hypothetical protein